MPATQLLPLATDLPLSVSTLSLMTMIIVIVLYNDVAVVVSAAAEGDYELLREMDNKMRMPHSFLPHLDPSECQGFILLHTDGFAYKVDLFWENTSSSRRRGKVRREHRFVRTWKIFPRNSTALLHDLAYDVIDGKIYTNVEGGKLAKLKYFSVIYPTSGDLRFTTDPISQTMRGKGTFGSVWLTRLTRPGHSPVICAEKIVKLTRDKAWNRVKRDVLCNEVAEDAAITIYYVAQSDNMLKFFMSNESGGSFYHLIKAVRSHRLPNGDRITFSEAEVKHYFQRMLYVVGRIHQKNLVHRDIKPDNFLLDVKGLLRAGDFGWAARLDEREELGKTYIGSVGYKCPEAMIADRRRLRGSILASSSYFQADKYCDLYAVAIIAYEMLFLHKPELLFNNAGQMVLSERTKRNIEKIVNQSLYIYIDAALTTDKETRKDALNKVTKQSIYSVPGISDRLGAPPYVPKMDSRGLYAVAYTPVNQPNMRIAIPGY